MKRLCICGIVCGLFVFGIRADGQTVDLAPVVVTSNRSLDSSNFGGFKMGSITSADLETAPGLTLDEALRSNPSFSLFRRSDSLTAHPTTQGVSLRGLGPSGASRSLVLLDGVPLNDPFGGWVQWAKLPKESLQAVEIDAGGGATAWGNSALGGVISLTSFAPLSTGGKLTATVGDFDTRSVEWEADEKFGHSALQLSGQLFSSNGYHVVAPESAGAIDIPASTRNQSVSGKWLQQLTDGTTATLVTRFFHETRDNGTPYQVNRSREAFASLAIDSQVSPGFRWNATAYGQDDTFSSTFSSVSATRASETPASNQYDVPSSAAGFAWTGDWRSDTGDRTLAGADLRHVRGESREDLTYSNGAYTRNRVSGGAQSVGGIFFQREQRLAPDWIATIGVRTDFWDDYDGHRRERDLVTGATLRNDADPSRNGVEWSPSLKVGWQAEKNLRLTIGGQEAFRRPTLNELYRPFRVGNVITEANPALGTERVKTVELGAEWKLGSLTQSLSVFDNELHGAVGSVTVAHGPGNVAGFGFIPAGGLGRLRENLDLVRVRGAEWSGRWEVVSGFFLTAAGLANDAEVVHAHAAPNLVGLRVAEVPRLSGSIGFTWKKGPWEFAPRGRWIGAQFEDDENQLRLAPAWIVDCTVSRDFGKNAQAYISVENLFNERIETGRSATNVINVGTPRFATGGLRVTW